VISKPSGFAFDVAMSSADYDARVLRELERQLTLRLPSMPPQRPVWTSTASELRTRGYYLGSNVSYNVKKLVEMGYLHHARSRVDRRAVRISLTPKGRQVHDIVRDLYDKHARTIEPIGGISGDDFQRLNQALMRLERFWTDQIRYRL